MQGSAAALAELGEQNSALASGVTSYVRFKPVLTCKFLNPVDKERACLFRCMIHPDDLANAAA